nr:T9SS type A sorting domain-containing protein [Bacteroidota bacterium]
MPFDIDGDSLYWQLDTPLTSVGLYVTGYTYPYADTSMPFTMNPNTGEVSFMPSTIGYFQASFLVNEYRAGVKIGEIRRDMQIIVVPGLAPPPIVNTTSNTFPYSGKQFYLTPGTSFTMTLTATDNDNRFISVIGNGEPFINGNGATVTTSNGIGGASAVINWTPTANQQRNAAYVAALRVSQAVYNYTFANDYSISLFVGVIPAGINDNSNVKGVSDVYPNPTSGSFNIDYNAANATSINVKVYDLLGSLIVTKSNININAGINIVSINDANLSKGKYILKIETPNEKPVTRPLTVE